MKARHEWKHGSRGIHILELTGTPLKFPCLSFGSSMLRTCLANAYFTTYHALLNPTACFIKRLQKKQNTKIILSKKKIKYLRKSYFSGKIKLYKKDNN